MIRFSKIFPFNGFEIDLLTQNGNAFDIFEIKSTETIMSQQFKGMNFFEDITRPKVSNKTLIYGGDENQERTNATVIGWRNL